MEPWKIVAALIGLWLSALSWIGVRYANKVDRHEELFRQQSGSDERINGLIASFNDMRDRMERYHMENTDRMDRLFFHMMKGDRDG